MPVATLGKIPFAPIDHAGLPPSLTSAIVTARERTAGLLAGLRANRERVLADPENNELRQHKQLTQSLNSARVDLGAAFDAVQRQAEKARDAADAQLRKSVYGDAEIAALMGGDPEKVIAPTRVTLASLIGRADLSAPPCATDSTGAALLDAGNAVHVRLARVLETGTVRAGSLIVRAIESLETTDPLAFDLLGGRAVLLAARRTVEARAAAEDPRVLEHAAARDTADLALSILKGDRTTAHEYSHRAAFGRKPEFEPARKSVGS